MIFMFTNAFRNGRALQMEQVATRLRSFLESERAAYEKAFGASFRDFFNVFHCFLGNFALFLAIFNHFDPVKKPRSGSQELDYLYESRRAHENQHESHDK